MPLPALTTTRRDRRSFAIGPILAAWVVLGLARVSEAGDAAPLSFRLDVEPVLTKYGCNSGTCHGKASGQNGFKLSLFGFDPEFDFAAVAQEGLGRRVSPAAFRT